jgi:hypothetical protein
VDAATFVVITLGMYILGSTNGSRVRVGTRSSSGMRCGSGSGGVVVWVVGDGLVVDMVISRSVPGVFLLLLVWW